MFKPEDLVFSYTDEDALRDGTLVAIRGLAPYPINRATRAVFEAFTSSMGTLPPGLGGSPVTDVTRLIRLADAVGARARAGELDQGMVVIYWEGRKVWAMANGTIYGSPPYDKEGWTIMFPEDY